MESCELTILMPCLNEAETLATCIKRQNCFYSGKYSWLLIADGSTDGSREIAEQLARYFCAYARLWCSIKSGIQHALGQYIIIRC